MIYIYNDLGADKAIVQHTIFTLNKLLSPKYQINTINAEQVIQGSWQQNVSMFVMPGGADLPFVAKLNGVGNNIIKEYVQNGGSYLGICAGAYYASSYVEFDKAGVYEVLGERELKFFPGKSIGPVLAKFDYFTRSGARAAEIKTQYSDDMNI